LSRLIDIMHKVAYASTRISSGEVHSPAPAPSSPAKGNIMTMSGLDKWYGCAKSHDTAALWDLLHPDAVFESPIVHTPQCGRDITFKYLASAEKALGGPGFKYVGEWRSADGAVLEFENEIEGIRINGVDIITFSDDDKITH